MEVAWECREVVILGEVGLNRRERKTLRKAFWFTEIMQLSKTKTPTQSDPVFLLNKKLLVLAHSSLWAGGFTASNPKNSLKYTHLLAHILQVKAANHVSCGGYHLGSLLIPDFRLAGRVHFLWRGMRAFSQDLLLVMQLFSRRLCSYNERKWGQNIINRTSYRRAALPLELFAQRWKKQLQILQN